MKSASPDKFLKIKNFTREYDVTSMDLQVWSDVGIRGDFYQMIHDTCNIR